MYIEKFEKTDKEIKDQIINWFIKYHRQLIDNFTGQEEFTLFDKLSLEKQKNISSILLANELAVLILQRDNKTIIICTTRRFIYLENKTTQELTYADFQNHIGYKSIAIVGDTGSYINIKTNGYISDFGLKRNDNQTIYWKITTGQSGFAFWNITHKFAIIGRKYIICEAV